MLEIFSSGYFITDRELRITQGSKDYVAVSPDLYDRLEVQGGPVVVKIEGKHWEVEPAEGVMMDTIEVPRDTFDYNDTVFVARPGNAEEILSWEQ